MAADEGLTPDQRTLNQISQRLHELFDGLIDMRNVSDNIAAREDAFLTRSYLALYLMEKANLSPSAAASCITDDGSDDGVDAICIDKKNAKIILGQSKWKKDARKGIQLSEYTRFRDGVRDVISLKWNDENAALHRFKDDIEEQLKNIDTEVIMVLAHTSSQDLSR